MQMHGIQGVSRTIIGRIVLTTLALLFVCSSSFASGSKDSVARSATAEPNEVVVWTYDSFTSEWGPGPAIAEAFKNETGITIRFVTQGDGGALLSKIIAEGTTADADVLLGIDQNLQQKAIDANILTAYKPQGAEKIPTKLILDSQYRLTPYDFGYFAIIYDSEKISAPPKSLDDLTKKEFERKLILMDPRTSTPGLGFFVWTKAVYGNEWKNYWKKLAPSILTVAEGWDTGYGLFTSGEAPMVLSYTTSPAYHLEFDKTERYRAALFDDQGHSVQIEGAGILKNSKRPKNAKRFMDFMLSQSFQKVIPLTNWMYPIVETPLPPSYRIAPKPGKTVRAEAPTNSELTEWARIVGSK